MPLTEEERQKCKEAFAAFDKDGTGCIDRFELRVVLEAMGQKPSEEELFRMLNEVDEDNTGYIPFSEFLRLIEQQKDASNDDELDLIDAFVAMGGNPDKTGNIKRDKLVQIIRHQFEMTIDIEVSIYMQRLIDEIDEDDSGEIEYNEFKQLLTR